MAFPKSGWSSGQFYTPSWLVVLAILVFCLIGLSLVLKTWRLRKRPCQAIGFVIFMNILTIISLNSTAPISSTLGLVHESLVFTSLKVAEFNPSPSRNAVLGLFENMDIKFLERTLWTLR